MRYFNPLVTKNYSVKLPNPNSNKCRTKKSLGNFKFNKFLNNKNKSNKDRAAVNLVLGIFTWFFFYKNSNAIDFNKNIKNTPASVIVDGNLLGIKREDIFNEKFLFSHRTTQNTEIESEIEEIEDDEFRYSAWKNSQVGLTVGGSALSIWFVYKGLNVWEKWMKDQEQKDIEEEIEMTGTYINPGAGNVESSIDPITGKKIEIKPSQDTDNDSKKSE